VRAPDRGVQRRRDDRGREPAQQPLVHDRREEGVNGRHGLPVDTRLALEREVEECADRVGERGLGEGVSH
jgi:hypothetical protein